MPKENTSTQNQSQAPIRRCGIVKGQMYFTEEVIEGCAITEKTLEYWMENGLRSAKPKTKSRFFLGDDIIAFMFSQK